MKTNSLITILLLVVIVSCKKSVSPITDAAIKKSASNNVNNSNTYSSLHDFFVKNGVQKQTYSINSSAGGMFTTPHGTKVIIPPYAFRTESGNSVSGNITIEFKDIYTKSEMLLSNVPSMMNSGWPLKSGGEFFIKALSSNTALLLDSNSVITVQQPTNDADSLMMPFVNANPQDTNDVSWQVNQFNDVYYSASNYIYSLYSFNAPASSGTWCNSDNSSYFSNYTQTPLSVTVGDMSNYQEIQVFLVFKNVNSMVHIYYSNSMFSYMYAPLGLECTVVSIGLNNGKIYSAFVPLTISTNQVISVSLTETSDANFTSALNALN